LILFIVTYFSIKRFNRKELISFFMCECQRIRDALRFFENVADEVGRHVFVLYTVYFYFFVFYRQDFFNKQRNIKQMRIE